MNSFYLHIYRRIKKTMYHHVYLQIKLNDLIEKFLAILIEIQTDVLIDYKLLIDVRRMFASVRERGSFLQCYFRRDANLGRFLYLLS